MGTGNLREKLTLIKKAVFKFWSSKQKRVISFLSVAVVLFMVFVRIPKPLFDVSYATVLRSHDGKLLDAAIADDEQWRFPPLDSIPEKFKIALLLYEDEYFYSHLGVNPISIVRATRQNMSAGKIVSGGSTISMQTIRMALGNKKRTYGQKIIEILKTIKFELIYSKKSILKSYVNHAPFGSNIVGLNAASWRYFSRDPHKLSWGEIATLAVLPNNPKRIFPGNNHAELIRKRNLLLDKICSRGHFDENVLDLYKLEKIPTRIAALPNYTPHLLQRAIAEKKDGENIISTLDFDLQKKVSQTVKRHNIKLSEKEINNAAALVLDIKTGNVLAYVGNTSTSQYHAKYVDIITANRSPGSLLKPFLYAASLDEGIILPHQLIEDIPLYYNGFIPKNFDRKFRGVVKANEALTSSLNVPFINLLIHYGNEKFYHLLKKMGYNNLKYTPSHYGLSLILGTAETSLWEISSLYAGMARTYLNYQNRPLNLGYSTSDYSENSYYIKKNIKNSSSLKQHGYLSVGAIEATLTAMQQLKRPEQESGWESFLSRKKIAWKTGTSYGFKDAWSIGINDTYLVGVWVGNADGEARPDLVGSRSAAPLMFDLFRHLDGSSILQETPHGSAEDICIASGMLSKKTCPNNITQPLTDNFYAQAKKCTYHQTLKLNVEKTYQVDSNCYSTFDMVHESYFVLTPIQAWYYRKYHPNYTFPPPFSSNCTKKITHEKLQLLYPQNDAKILIPKEQSGKTGSVIFQAAHQNEKAKIFWHLDHSFIGVTEQTHQIAVKANPGRHLLTLVDDSGNEILKRFSIVSKKNRASL